MEIRRSDSVRVNINGKLFKTWVYHTSSEEYFQMELINNKQLEFCEGCGSIISTGYVYIITKLRENNLLQEDYRNLCCKCYIKNSREVV